MRNRKARSALRIGLAVALAATGWTRAAEEEGEKAPGLDVGVKAPAFKLKDQSGKDVALADLLKKGPVALVFHRSADW